MSNFFSKEININKKVLVLLILINFIAISLYTSYALFEITVIKDDVIVLKTVDINIFLTSNELTNNKTLTLAGNETKSINITLTNQSSIDVLARLYYISTTNDISFECDTAFIDSNDNAVGGITKNSNIVLTIQVKNNTENNISLDFGVSGGLIGYEIELESNQNPVKFLGKKLSDALGEVLTLRTNSYVLEDNIKYISGDKDDNNQETTADIDFNYVWYSGKLWRVTALYPDGTIKMITDDLITSLHWGATGTVSSSDLTSVYGTTGHIRQWTNQEFLTTLYNHENLIEENAGWYSIAGTSATPVKPSGDYTVILPVGILNNYEYAKAYEKASSVANNYLNIGYYWWLMTPYNYTQAWYINDTGVLTNYETTKINCGVRPAILLKSDVRIIGGDGTNADPYLLKDDIEGVSDTITRVNERVSGEYVKLENSTGDFLFRIVDKEVVGENLTTKIVLDDYVRSSGTVQTKNLANSASYNLWTEMPATNTTYWRGYLNITWIQEIDNTYDSTNKLSEILEKGTYYLGLYGEGTNYKATTCSSVDNEISVRECIANGTVVSTKATSDYIGLPRVGEMFSSQQGNGSGNSNHFWLITSFSSTRNRAIATTAEMYARNANDDKFAAKPTVNLKSTIVIKSGSGTKNDPFIVGLPN